MRLIAVPLARLRPSASPVTTFLAQSTKASSARPRLENGTSSMKASIGTPTSSSSSSSSSLRSGKSASSDENEEEKPPLMKRLMNKASDFWIGLGREDQTSTLDWKKRTYNMGEKLMDRIDYEEWALKGVDPTLGPSLNPEKVAEKRKERKEGQDASKDVQQMVNNSSIAPVAALNVPLLFPSSLLSSSVLLSSLQRMTAARQPHHRQRLIYSIIAMPFTIPFILVPVVPNLPFFYLCWRAWSHYRALSSSQYLAELIKQGRIVPTPSQELDRILSVEAPNPPPQPKSSPPTSNTKTTEQQSKDGAEEKKIDYEQFMLLKPQTIKDLVKTFNLEHQLSIDLTRARQQTIKSIQNGQMDKLEKEAENADKKVDL